MAFPGTYNFDYYRGDTHQMVVNPKTSGGTANFPLTGYSALYTIANQRGSSATQYAQTATVDSINGTITCTISATNGRNLVPGTYVYDVQITKDDLVYTVLTGSIVVTDDITGAVA